MCLKGHRDHSLCDMEMNLPREGPAGLGQRDSVRWQGRGSALQLYTVLAGTDHLEARCAHTTAVKIQDAQRPGAWH